MTNLDLISEAIKMIERIDTEDVNKELAINRMKQFVLLNTPQPKGGKVKIYDWVYKDDNLRPQMSGVYHDCEGKVAVATDTRALIVSKRDYIECEESHIVAKNGDEIRGKFPEYKRVMPDNDERLIFVVDREKVKQLLAQYKAERKLDKSVEYKAINVSTSEHPFYLHPDLCKLLLQLPEGDFYADYNSQYGSYNSRPLSYESEDGNYEALFMPLYYPDHAEDVILKED